MLENLVDSIFDAVPYLGIIFIVLLLVFVIAMIPYSTYQGYQAEKERCVLYAEANPDQKIFWQGGGCVLFEENEFTYINLEVE